MQVSLAVIAVIGATALLWGVGTLVDIRTCRRPPSITAVGVGLSVLLFAGGVLNLFRIAYAPALWLLAVVGMVCLFFAARRTVLPRRVEGPQAIFDIVLAAIVIAAGTGFTAYLQIEPSIFNWHDDHEKYFAHPVRMLATGTLVGSPLNALGSQTLGGQAFLHAFVLSVLPINYINWVDAILGFFLLLLIAAWAGWRHWAPLPGAAVAAALVAFINPQYVNVSPLFLPAALMATAVLLVAEPSRGVRPDALRLGLVYGALISLKPLYAVFVVVHCTLLSVAVWLRSRSFWKAARGGGCIAAATCAAALPWVLLHAGNFLTKGTLGHTPAPFGDDGHVNLFSREVVFYGNSFTDYTILAVFAAATGLASLLIVLRQKDIVADPLVDAQALGGMVGLLSYLIIIFFGPLVAGYQHSLRYAIPFLLACSVLAITIGPDVAAAPARFAFQALRLLGVIVILCIFLPSMIQRHTKGLKLGTMLSFVQNGPLGKNPSADQTAKFIANFSQVRSPAIAKHIREIQSRIPEGSSLLVWITVPFHLDYRRNEIIDVDTAGLATSWAHIPGNVRYVLWQYRGMAVRDEQHYQAEMSGPGQLQRLISARSLEFYKFLNAQAQKSKIIVVDPYFILFEFTPPNGAID